MQISSFQRIRITDFQLYNRAWVRDRDDTHLELPCDNSKFYYSDPPYRRDSKVPGPYSWLVWPYQPPAPWPGRCVQPRVEHHWVKPLFGFKHNLSLSTQGLPHGTGLGLLLVGELIVTASHFLLQYFSIRLLTELLEKVMLLQEKIVGLTLLPVSI